MHENVKKLWLGALESGEYAQGKEVLKSGDTFCCLGVLCDLHRRTTSGSDWLDEELELDTDRAFNRYQPNSGDTSSEALPEAVMKWAGLEHANPDIPIPDGVGNAMRQVLKSNMPRHKGKGITSIAELNDNDFDFKAIAGVIRKSL